MRQPEDRHVENLRKALNSVNGNDLTKRLRRALAVTRDAGDTRPDGYPTSTPGNGSITTTGVKTIDIDDDHVPVTSVEAAVLRRIDHTDQRQLAHDRHLQLTLDAYAALDTAVLSLQRCERLLDRIDTLRDDTGLEPAEPGCWAMARIDKWEPVHRRTVVDGDTYGLGRWAYEWVRDTGRLPTLDECRAHHEGRKVIRPVA